MKGTIGVLVAIRSGAETRVDIEAVTGMSRSAVRSAIYQLRNKFHIKRKNPGPNGKAIAIYLVTASGIERIREETV